MSMSRQSVLRFTLGAIGVVQVILGLVFIFAPGQFASALGLAATPVWVPWMFAMFGARAFGYAYGMFIARRDPDAHRPWILSMIGVQAIDWLATVYFLVQGNVTVSQVAVAPVLPIVFIVGLALGYPRPASSRQITNHHNT